MRAPWKSEVKPQAPPLSSFGGWVLRSFLGEEAVATMAFARLEQVCSNAALLVCGAVYAEPAAFAWPVSADGAEAVLVARRTADGFTRALADRNRSVLAWPWDHIATRVTWQLTQEGVLAEARLGPMIESLTVAYTSRYREQLTSVLVVWAEVAAGLASGPPPDLTAMGRTALREFKAAGDMAPAGGRRLR